MFVSLRKCLGTDTPQTSTFTTHTPKNQAMESRNGSMLCCKKGTSNTSIMTSKCFYTLHWLYTRYFYHSGNAVVPILNE